MTAPQPLHSQPPWLKRAIEAGRDLHYARTPRLWHNALNSSLLLALVGGAIALCWLGGQVKSIAFIPLGALGFGLIYFSLFILVVHEASHNMFLNVGTPRRSRLWNRRLGWLVCIPFGVEYVKHWELGHRIHHRAPTEPDDPQNCKETLYTHTALLSRLAKVLLIPGYAILRLGASCPAERYGRNWSLKLASVIVWSVALAIEAVFLHWTVAVAALLGLHVLVALNTVKITMEHGGAVSRRGQRWMRSCSSFFPLRRVLMPFNISLHFEHHLNAAVPWYNLMTYHQEIAAIVPAEIRPDVFKGDREVWQQMANR
ncbi:MAG: fatty acid desaturase [Cyanobacteria bacterium P01_F01_bin.33]